MNRYPDQLSSFYRQVLRLYPPGFRENYVEEMAAVFDLQLKHHRELSRWQTVRIALKELLPLPGLLIAAYWRERRHHPMKTTLNRWFAQSDPGSWSELFLAGIPFLMMGILPAIFSLIPAIKDLPPRYGIPILVLMTLILVALGIIGLLVSLPRWSLVYAGILIALLPLLIIVFSINLELVPTPPGWGSIPTTAVFLAIFLIVQFLLAGLLLWLSRKVNLTAGFYQRVKFDPSLLAFMFYGGSFLIMHINYDDIAEGGYYMILSSAVMIVGAWVFLKSVNTASRLMALTIGISAAMVLALIANLTLLDYPMSPVEIGPVPIPRTVIYIGLTWMVSLIMILLPAVAFRPAAQPNQA